MHRACAGIGSGIQRSILYPALDSRSREHTLSYLIGGVFKCWHLLQRLCVGTAHRQQPVFRSDLHSNLLHRTQDGRREMATAGQPGWALLPYAWYWAIHWVWDTTMHPVRVEPDCTGFHETGGLGRDPRMGWVRPALGPGGIAQSFADRLSPVLRDMGLVSAPQASVEIPGRRGPGVHALCRLRRPMAGPQLPDFRSVHFCSRQPQPGVVAGKWTVGNRSIQGVPHAQSQRDRVGKDCGKSANCHTWKSRSARPLPSFAKIPDDS